MSATKNFLMDVSFAIGEKGDLNQNVFNIADKVSKLAEIRHIAGSTDNKIEFDEAIEILDNARNNYEFEILGKLWEKNKQKTEWNIAIERTINRWEKMKLGWSVLIIRCPLCVLALRNCNCCIVKEKFGKSCKKISVYQDFFESQKDIGRVEAITKIISTLEELKDCLNINGGNKC